MATTTRVLTASVNGTVYTTNANGALEAIDTCHSGATAPTDEVANGKFWLDTTTTPGILKVYNNAVWEVVHDDTTFSITPGTGIDVTGTVLADGLTVDGVGQFIIDDTTVYSPTTDSIEQLRVKNFDTTTAYTPSLIDFQARGTTTTTSSWQIGNAGLNSAYAESDFFIKNRLTASVYRERMRIEGNGDISFYEDTGTTPKFFWDASAESLGIGTASPAATLDVRGAAADVRVFDTTTVAQDVGGKINLSGYYTGTSENTYSQILGKKENGTDANRQGYFAVKTRSSGAGLIERMRVTSSGLVGIGTSTPSQPLHVSTATNPAVHITNTDGTNGSTLRIAMATNGAFIGTQNPLGGSDVLRFGTGNEQERMRITSAGDILFNTTTLSDGSNNSMSWSNTGDETLIISAAGTAGSYMIRFMNGNGVVGQIISDGSTTSYNTTSDYRLKENITTIQGAADIVKSMRPCTYTFKADSTDWHDGFLAHELQELHPRAVTGSKDAMKDEEYEVTPAVLDEDGAVVSEAVMGTRSVPDYQGVDYSKLTPILTAALQEALNKIDALEARLTALEAV